MNERPTLREKLQTLELVEGKEHLDEIQALIKDIEKKGEQIGRGMTADILVSPECPNVCLKAIRRKEFFRNGAHHEMELMQYAIDRGIRVPRPYGSLEDPGTDYLFMERIHGIDISTFVGQDQLDELPEGFDFKGFFEKLRAQVKEMNGQRLYHRDLHEGNVMITIDGSPVIIDLGSSIIQRMGGEDPYRGVDAKGGLVVYPNDLQRMQQSQRFLGDYLKSRGYFERKK